MDRFRFVRIDAVFLAEPRKIGMAQRQFEDFFFLHDAHHPAVPKKRFYRPDWLKPRSRMNLRARSPGTAHGWAASRPIDLSSGQDGIKY